MRAFGQLEQDEWTKLVRAVFVTLVLAGVRKGELLGLQWRNVKLTDPDGVAAPM